eukprot:GHVT01064941.1.p1 GENE.GHVT01064941.1~~GHVT01064941.1.p1  ORF type:complete len:151 (-),score=33.63 GHVT01064941.1:199-651(-)
MTDGDVRQVAPTLGFNIETRTYKSFQLNLWDVGGQKTIRSFWRNYFEQTDGLVWVVDAADRRRMDDCKEELLALLKEERLAGASLLLLANKQDLSGALSCDEVKQRLGLVGLTSGRHWSIFPCSAYSGEGLLQGIDWLIEDIADRIFVME